MKSRGGAEEEKRRAEERRSEKRKSQKKEDAGARKGRKVAKHCLFPMICGSRGSKSRLAKAAGTEPAGQVRDEKLHAVVARSTFPSQNVKNTRGSDHFWKLRCRKSARRCGAKHISKLKCEIWTFRCRFAWQAQGIVDLFESEQNVRVLLHFQLQPQLQLHLHYITLHYTPLHYNYAYTTLHSTRLHYTTLNHTTLHYITLHYDTFH